MVVEMENQVIDRVVDFVRAHYEKQGSVPSIRSIAKKHRRRGLTRSSIYRLFPGGLREICERAGVPLPSDRMRVVQPALNTRRAAESKPAMDSKILEILDAVVAAIQGAYDYIYFLSGSRAAETQMPLLDFYARLFEVDREYAVRQLDANRPHAYLWELEEDMLSEGDKKLRVEWARLLKKHCPEKLADLVL